MWWKSCFRMVSRSIQPTKRVRHIPHNLTYNSPPLLPSAPSLPLLPPHIHPAPSPSFLSPPAFLVPCGSGSTALHMAVAAAERTCVMQLVTRGTRQPCTSPTTRQPRTSSIAYHSKPLLHERPGANISLADQNGQTPMQIAVTLGHDNLQT